eukprot:7096371-Prymnesium_polylepis.1
METTESLLEALLPPVDFSEADAPSPSSDSALGLLCSALRRGSLSGAVGQLLGADDAVVTERWSHLAGDAAACEAIKSS